MQTDPRPEIPKFCWRHQAHSKVFICCLFLHQAPSHAKAQSAKMLEPAKGRVMEGPKQATRNPGRPFNSRNSEPELPVQQPTLASSLLPSDRPHWLLWVMSSAPREIHVSSRGFGFGGLCCFRSATDHNLLGPPLPLLCSPTHCPLRQPTLSQLL